MAAGQETYSMSELTSGLRLGLGGLKKCLLSVTCTVLLGQVEIFLK